MARCDLTDLPVDMCAHCLGHKGPEQPTGTDRAAILNGGRWIEARYRGRCAGCGETYDAGAAIRRAEPDGWIAECCAEER